MLLEQLIELSWSVNNKVWLESKGYIFTKYRGIILVRAHDLSESCNKKVDIQCDYCGEKTTRCYSDYTISIKENVVKKDSCMKCKPIKVKEAYNILYGVDHQSQVPSIIEQIASSNRLSYEFIKNEFKKADFKLMTKEYINAKQSLEFICNIHEDEGIQTLDYSNFKQGRRCQYCNMDIRRIKLKEKYKKIVENKNFTFVDVHFDGYHSKKMKIEVVCKIHFDKGNQFVTPTNFNKQSGCKFCGREKQGIGRRIDILTVEKAFINRNYNVINVIDYKGNSTKLDFVCNKHLEDGIQTTTYAGVKKSQTCKSCVYEGITGENHYLWKGGISPLHNYLRCKIGEWKKESLRLNNYQCEISGIKGKLVVHHLVSFSQILNETLEELGYGYSTIGEYTDEELKLITNNFLIKHDEYGYGITLSTKIHDTFHSVYGRGDTTKEQFSEFKENYIAGKYKEVS